MTKGKTFVRNIISFNWLKECHQKKPEPTYVGEGHYTKCHFATEPGFIEKNAPATSRTKSAKGGE